MKKWGTIGFLIYVALGLYFINFAFSFVTLPKFVLEINKWIFFVGGVLIFIGAINSLKKKRKRKEE